ncbi:hypothetical protein OsJ_12210 [Oryza sativa Japonica Group]|uniref:Late embryogenesis abundant protein LEA-2 subgroup domain-containing protein n=1 Tax=Oryza sativa subsp. japonica TaxID=39947 RepID=B9FAR0_ORYSJ|nr:hypothetical protein OsJ_12210 [Oryza sativa Japonica Group]
MAKAQPPPAREPLLPSSASPPPYLDARAGADANADSYVLLVPVRLRRLRRGCRCRCLGPLLSTLALLSLAGVRVRNPDLFALDYGRLDVDIGYRGAPLGRVTSGGGRVRARAVSYIDANLSLDGISVVEDAIYLLEDLARGSVPFDTVAEVEGHVHLFFLSIPVKICLEKY